MAHEIDMSNGKVNYAYVAEHGTVWHGLGSIVPLHSSLTTWKQEAGLEWKAKESPILFNDGNDMPTIFQGKKALYRSDNNAQLSVVGSDYKIVQPSEIVDFFGDILDRHDMEMSSCGSLFNGKRLFATAKLNDMEIISGDVINGYLLITTSLDGSLATTAKAVSRRVVCSNTLTMALNESSKNMIRVPHSTEFNASKAKLDLGLIEDSQYNFIESMKKLTSISCTETDALKFYQEMFYNKDVSAEDQHGTIVKKVNDIMLAYRFGNGAEYGKNTFYNILQAGTDYYSNSIKSRTESAQFWSSYYGTGDKIKLDIQKKLLAMV